MRAALMEILEKRLEVKAMDEDKDTWRAIENDPGLCVEAGYGYGMVAYQNAYFSDVHDMLEDVSVVIYNGGTAAGIWPLSIYKSRGECRIGSWGGVLLPPLLCGRGNAAEPKRKLLGKCLEALREICSRFGIERYVTADICLGSGASIWMQMLLERGARHCGLSCECYVDLSLDEQDILSKMRRTNRYSIQKSGQTWKSEIITGQDGRLCVEERFRQFRELHIEVSGRETRSKKTWDMQCEAVLHANDFMVLLHDREGRLIGASLYGTTGSVGVYSVAAYRRELFGQPVGHASQWLAIGHMKKLGLKWYCVGRRAYPGDWDRPTEKEVSIGHFKEGFATGIYPRAYMEMQGGSLGRS